MSEFKKLVETGLGYPVAFSAPATVDLKSLNPMTQSLILIEPGASNLEGHQQALALFVARRGRVCILSERDDSLLNHFEIAYVPKATSTPHGAVFQNNPAFQFADVSDPLPGYQIHEVIRGVPRLLTNHARALIHPELKSLVILDQGALVLLGVIGEGRLIAIGDSSLWINNMMAFEPHKTFASNITKYLTEAGKRSLVFAGPQTKMVATGSWDNWATRLSKSGRLQLPMAAIKVESLLLLILPILFIVGTASWKKRNPFPFLKHKQELGATRESEMMVALSEGYHHLVMLFSARTGMQASQVPAWMLKHLGEKHRQELSQVIKLLALHESSTAAFSVSDVQFQKHIQTLQTCDTMLKGHIDLEQKSRHQDKIQ